MNLRTLVLGLAVVATAGLNSYMAQADSQLDTLIKNPSNWAAQAGDYANHRYSKLKQINESNVGKLQVAWTMSTGVLRGHEGSPLVIGDTMYIHTPFPNNVYRGQPEGSDFQVEVRAEAGRGRGSRNVLRHGQPRSRLWRRQDLPAAGRYDARRARCEDWQSRVDA